MLQILHFIGSLAGAWRVKWRGTFEQELAMLKKLILAAAGLAISAPVLADREWRHERHDGYRHHHYRHFGQHYYDPRPVVVVPPPVYYAPAPLYYAPPPRVYYAPPPPVFYPPAPHNGISIRLHFPL
ncbi:MAG: hypothetical protein ACREUS_12755 [Burkholderiales bacterium]